MLSLAAARQHVGMFKYYVGYLLAKDMSGSMSGMFFFVLTNDMSGSISGVFKSAATCFAECQVYYC